jgi:hypothetical protein
MVSTPSGENEDDLLLLKLGESLRMVVSGKEADGTSENLNEF